jgi:hypothetical protein
LVLLYGGAWGGFERTEADDSRISVPNCGYAEDVSLQLLPLLFGMTLFIYGNYSHGSLLGKPSSDGQVGVFRP